MVRATTQPPISVVTPFHNTEPYLAECIESVLGQTYTNFEYILVDNCSVDGSTEIAESYARRDRRIRTVRRSQLLSQLKNYNGALLEISDTSKYCKIVEADNYIFPDCLDLMVRVFEQSDSIGLVSSYRLVGNELVGSGYPVGIAVLAGRECARRHLRGEFNLFGSPTTLMYRSSLIGREKPFFDESALHADTEKCMEILQNWDFGFAPQVLSFLRTENESISSSVRQFRGGALDSYIVVQRYARTFMDQEQATSLMRKSKRNYYRVLARQMLKLRERALLRYHEEGLKRLEETITWPYLMLQMIYELLWMILNPGMTIANLIDSGRRWMDLECDSRTPSQSTERSTARVSETSAS
jgi:glycosyltransferase involved in cell wall biosynthesis